MSVAGTVSPPNDYSVFGLRVRSEVPLPELFPAASPGHPDVTIRVGPITDAHSDAGLHSIECGLLFVAPDAGRYWIANGSEIIVEPNSGAPARNVRLYLLGSAFGALLHQRGLLPLHANAVEIDGKAVAFMGQSGAGKSTLAAWFHDQGHRVIADDVCVVKFAADGRAIAVAGLPRLRLWQDALEMTGRRCSDFQHSYAGDPLANKFDVPIGAGDFGRRETELAAIYDLQKSDSFAVVPLHGLEAAETVFAHTYRGGFVAAANGEQTHWTACVKLVRSTPIFRVTRPWKLDQLGEFCGKIFEHAEGTGNARNTTDLE